MIKAHFGSRRGFVRYLWNWFKYVVLRQGRQYYQLPERIDRYVFVCKGNICRSPFAEEVCKKLSPVETASFGLDTTTGNPAHEPIISLAKDMDVDLADHRTLEWDDFIPKEFDLYVCVEPDHADFLASLMPDAAIVLIGSFLTPAKPYIHDPYNTANIYRINCLRTLETATRKLISGS